MQIFCKSNFFKEHEVFYTFKDNGMTYQENEEAIFYSFPQFKRINYKDFILLKKNQKILFVDLNDLDQLENDIEETKIKKSSFLISLFTSVIGCSLLVLQLGYLVILKRFEFEYIHSMNNEYPSPIIFWVKNDDKSFDITSSMKLWDYGDIMDIRVSTQNCDYYPSQEILNQLEELKIQYLKI